LKDYYWLSPDDVLKVSDGLKTLVKHMPIPFSVETIRLAVNDWMQHYATEEHPGERITKTTD
jgi:hypothetical protein